MLDLKWYEALILIVTLALLLILFYVIFGDLS